MQFETTSQPGVKNSASLSQHLHFQGLVETYKLNIHEKRPESGHGGKKRIPRRDCYTTRSSTRRSQMAQLSCRACSYNKQVKYIFIHMYIGDVKKEPAQSTYFTGV